jgi:hypothetical protein
VLPAGGVEGGGDSGEAGGDGPGGELGGVGVGVGGVGVEAGEMTGGTLERARSTRVC